MTPPDPTILDRLVRVRDRIKALNEERDAAYLEMKLCIAEGVDAGMTASEIATVLGRTKQSVSAALRSLDS